jgi:hypothetical protein
MPRITEVIATLTGASLHPGHVWRIMGQLGWSPLSPARRAIERAAAAAEWVATRWGRVRNARRRNAWLVFEDESGISLTPPVRWT